MMGGGKLAECYIYISNKNGKDYLNLPLRTKCHLRW